MEQAAESVNEAEIVVDRGDDLDWDWPDSLEKTDLMDVLPDGTMKPPRSDTKVQDFIQLCNKQIYSTSRSHLNVVKKMDPNKPQSRSEKL